MENLELDYKDEIEKKYYTVLKFGQKRDLRSVVDSISKRLPKKVVWSRITVHIQDDDFVIYEHDEKRVVKDRRSAFLNNYGSLQVQQAVSNIDFNEHYYDIFIEKEK